MEHYFVFHHSLSIVATPIEVKIDKFISSLDFPQVEYNQTNMQRLGESTGIPINEINLMHVNKSLHELNYAIYLQADGETMFYFGKLQDDPDQLYSKNLMTINLPKAEYLFCSKETNLRNLPNVISKLSNIIEEYDLSFITAPLVIFPENLPISMNQVALMEIWLATDSDINGDVRLSDGLSEALPRKKFDFYRW